MKTCPFCAEQIQDAAIVCKHCDRVFVEPAKYTTAGAQGSGFVVTVLIVLGLVIAFYGSTTLTQATVGVGTIALGCFVLILARLIQAGRHADQRARWWTPRPPEKQP